MKKIMFNDRYGLTEAVLSGKKTMTRRIFSTEVYGKLSIERNPMRIDETRSSVSETSIRSHFPKYQVGEIVAVAQNYETISKEFGNECFPLNAKNSQGWHNKLFVRADLMPHRIQITNIKIEHLQDISNEDCFKEGIYKGQCGSKETHFMDAYYFKGEIQPYCTPRDAYSILIERIFDEYTWDKNPHVFVYEFKLIR